jgi:hypothetical protein
MMTRWAEQMRDAAVALSAGYLIDKFLDWLEELSVALVPAHVGELARAEVRTEAVLDRFNA